ncbi:MAG: YbaB/EbfC family nucleoid-associated protein [Methylococcaceae bacterium]|nr:YbaB/EbfC family nucleoid-associated protein [Methylococcaceae bacterium]
MKNPLASLMQQAQQMQDNIKKAQDELAATEIHGESGGGLVRIVMNGKREALKLSIDESLVKEDRDMLEDLVVAAINDAVHKVAKLKQDKMSSLTGGIQMPAGFKLPF